MHARVAGWEDLPHNTVWHLQPLKELTVEEGCSMVVGWKKPKAGMVLRCHFGSSPWGFSLSSPPILTLKDDQIEFTNVDWLLNSKYMAEANSRRARMT